MRIRQFSFKLLIWEAVKLLIEQTPEHHNNIDVRTSLAFDIIAEQCVKFRSEIVSVYSIPDLYQSIAQFFDSFILLANSKVCKISHNMFYITNNIYSLQFK